MLPLIQAHSLVEGLNFHRSLRYPKFPLASTPWPPKSQKSPLLSVQFEAPHRIPGMLAAAGVPNVPYTPGVVGPTLPDVLRPPIQVHSFVCAHAVEPRVPAANAKRNTAATQAKCDLSICLDVAPVWVRCVKSEEAEEWCISLRVILGLGRRHVNQDKQVEGVPLRSVGETSRFHSSDFAKHIGSNGVAITVGVVVLALVVSGWKSVGGHCWPRECFCSAVIRTSGCVLAWAQPSVFLWP